MSISPALVDFLSRKHVNYEVLEHSVTTNSLATAREAHVPAEKLAKAVVVKRGDAYAVCVIPAANQLILEWLKYGRQHEYELASEEELSGLFPDCKEGAIPCLGQAYHMDVIVDNTLLDNKDIYLEGGDHTHLLHINHRDFSMLMRNAWQAPISCLKGDRDDSHYL